ncbi:MAG: cache domain-containing protein [Desulfobacterales bacterium]|nr:cache domain-containing protein [Desulfobacterales bacterium]
MRVLSLHRESMNPITGSILALALGALLLCQAATARAEEAPRKIIDLAHARLTDLAQSRVIISAVRTANAKNQSLESIKAMDAQWKNTPGIVDYMQAMMESECGRYLRKIQDSDAYYAEIFVMDNQGANVAMTDKTSDYWQGDEAKFQKAFNQGQGAVFVDQVEFDDSAQAYLVQVSVPVMDGNQVIGTVTFGINVDALED